jgi:hypothetical protein
LQRTARPERESKWAGVRGTPDIKNGSNHFLLPKKNNPGNPLIQKIPVIFAPLFLKA